MDPKSLIILGASALLLINLKKQKMKRKIRVKVEEKKKKKKIRVNPFLQERNLKGKFFTDYEEMVTNSFLFKENFHMSVEEFNSLFNLLELELKPKCNSRPHDFISPKQKLAIVLEFLASGDHQQQIATCYRLSKQHFGRIIDHVCDAIAKTLKDNIPDLNKEKFIQIANDFNAQISFPNCIGAIDAKHVRIKARCAKQSNDTVHNSIFILAICDASYKFTYLDIGEYDKKSDGNIFKKSKFGQDLMNGCQDFPEGNTINHVKLPYFYIGNDVFPLSKHLLIPYSKKILADEERIFNEHLSRASQCIDNAFGILCWKWLCLKKIMFCQPDRVKKIILACCLLHNYLIKKETSYCPIDFSDRIDIDGLIVEGQWRKNIIKVPESLYYTSINKCLDRPSDSGKFIRNCLKDYVNSLGY